MSALVKEHGDRGALNVVREQLQERRREIEQRSRKLREGSGGHWSLWVVALVFGLMFAYMLWKLRVP